MNKALQNRKAEQGFTLVELAIVMIIIGLLIGGILKGQELITNARVASTVAQIKGIDAASTTFRDKYDGMAGDLANANARLTNCLAAPCFPGAPVGIGNGRVDGAGSQFAAPGGESLAFFPQLATAGLLSGVSPQAGAAGNVWGGNFPEAEIGGGYYMSYFAGNALPPGAVGIAAANVRSGHYLALHGTPAGPVAAASTAITPNQVARIDQKLDDGNPTTGTVFPGGTAANCTVVVGATTIYNEDADQQNCFAYILIQQ